jgi:hypothetical protein
MFNIRKASFTYQQVMVFELDVLCGASSLFPLLDICRNGRTLPSKRQRIFEESAPQLLPWLPRAAPFCVIIGVLSRRSCL